MAHRGEGRMDDINGRDMGQIEIKDLIAKKVDAAMDCGCAIAKLGILLFLKMLFLPFLLGMWLDFSTLKLFESSIKDRIEFAGTDIFAFVLLHWVSGITFMLFVTVSVKGGCASSQNHSLLSYMSHHYRASL
jgi:E3 ubiquitin-protein ligase MARCH6